mmetsp:Transcript_51033/g.163322  ORF Transcript_51033/g.163322 Transcript_51033/m.163322 type:complete len:288 (-) Transcript_51033:11-874(-)
MLRPSVGHAVVNGAGRHAMFGHRRKPPLSLFQLAGADTCGDEAAERVCAHLGLGCQRRLQPAFRLRSATSMRTGLNHGVVTEDTGRFAVVLHLDEPVLGTQGFMRLHASVDHRAVAHGVRLDAPPAHLREPLLGARGLARLGAGVDHRVVRQHARRHARLLHPAEPGLRAVRVAGPRARVDQRVVGHAVALDAGLLRVGPVVDARGVRAGVQARGRLRELVVGNLELGLADVPRSLLRPARHQRLAARLQRGGGAAEEEHEPSGLELPQCSHCGVGCRWSGVCSIGA